MYVHNTLADVNKNTYNGYTLKAASSAAVINIPVAIQANF